MNEHFIDIGWNSLKKHGELLCGDQVSVLEPNAATKILVLADGLGSGVKACILSTLTSKIISTMMARSMSIEECVETIAATLPVNAELGVAYSTFTIVRIIGAREAEIIQYDNPDVIFLRNGKNVELPFSYMEISGKRIGRAKTSLRENDLLICVSDGALHAGAGNSMNMDWERKDIVNFLEREYAEGMAAKAVATVLLDTCCRLYEQKPGDDTTVCALKVRPRAQVNLLVGPPQKREDDAKMLSLFFSKQGKRVVCGGTTAEMAARHLGAYVEMGQGGGDPDVPPISHVKGVDLTTEGVVTLTRVAEYARDYLKDNLRYFDWIGKQDGASRLARLLFEEATDINLYVGRAVNPAHQDPGLPLGFSAKMGLVEDLSGCLKQMGKRIKVSYF